MPRVLACFLIGGFALGRAGWNAIVPVPVTAVGSVAAGAVIASSVAAGAVTCACARAPRRRRTPSPSLAPYPTSSLGSSAGPPTDTSGVEAAPPACVRIAMMAVPTSTLCPGAAKSSTTWPAYGDGSSTTDLAVSISTMA